LLRQTKIPFSNTLCYCFRVISPSNPQFDTVEYGAAQVNSQCQFCHQPIGSTFYRVRASMACPSCADKLRAELTQFNPSPYSRALIWGIGAAILGLVLYATFTIVTGWIFSYIALIVGGMVGAAVKKGSGGAGGRRYQFTAATLTYVAISLAAVPVQMNRASQGMRAIQRAQAFDRNLEPKVPLTPLQQQAKEQQLAAEQRQLEDEFGQPHQNRLPLRPHPAAPTPNATPQPFPSAPAARRPPPTLFATILILAALSLASPILVLWTQGLSAGWAISVFIRGVGVYLAWRMTAGIGMVVSGPFSNTAT